MATNKQKQELIETLKFTPRTYTLNISGYGGESYAGVVDRKIYDFFKSKNIDINQYAWDYDDERWKDIPEAMRPFYPGSPYDCDNIFHIAGAELTDLNYVIVTDEKGDTHWETTASYSELDDQGVDVECSASNEFDDLDPGTVVFWAGQGEKGCFFEGEIELRAPFDPRLLRIYFESNDNWDIISSVEYDGEEIDGSNGYSTTGKWSDAKWIIVGDEEVYEGEERDDDYEPDTDDAISDDAVSAFSTLVQAIADVSWNPVDTKPTAKGEYEVKFAKGEWPMGDVRNAEWTGRSWKENGKKAPEMVGWRELEDE